MRDHVVTTRETWHDLRQNAWGDLKQASVILKGWISIDKSRSTAAPPWPFTQSPPNIGQKVLQNLHLGETHCHQPCCNAAMLHSNMRNCQQFTWIRNQYKKMTTTFDTLFLSIKAVSAIFRIVDLLQRPKIFLPEPKSYVCRFIAPPCPPPRMSLILLVKLLKLVYPCPSISTDHTV